MYLGKTLFAQAMDFLPWTTFHRIVNRYGGDHRTRSLSCAEQFRVMITHRPQTWKTDLAKAIQAVDWRKGPHRNGIAMVGERVNNTGPGIQATAGYVLRQAGLTAADGTEIP